MTDRERRAPQSELEAAMRRREAGPTELSALMGDAVVAGRDERARGTWRALRAWLSVNGSVERAHTTGVYVDKPSREGALPALVVYVDSKACEVDFRANAEVYLARLDAAGLRFSRVTFRQDRRRLSPAPNEPGSNGAGAHHLNQVRLAQGARPALPELSAEEAARVEALVSDLPEALRESVSRAMRMSLRREKQSNS